MNRRLLFVASGILLLIVGYVATVFFMQFRQTRAAKPLFLEKTINTKDVVGNLAISPDCSRIVTVPALAEGLGVQIIDLHTDQVSVLGLGDEADAYRVAMSPDGATFVIGTTTYMKYQGILQIWDMKTQSCRKKIAIGKGFVSAVVFDPDGKHVYCGTTCGDGIIYRVDIFTGEVGKVFDARSSKPVPTNWDHDIWSLAISPDGTELAIGLRMGMVVWNLQSQSERFSTTSKESATTSLSFSPDGKLLAVHGYNIQIWNYQTGKKIGELKSSGSLAFSPDGKLLVAGISGAVNFPSSVTVWKVDDYSQSVGFPCHADCLRTISFIPGTNRLVTGSNDRTVCIWDLDKLTWSNNEGMETTK